MIDRTGLILEIFGERARTSEGRLQVELAALTYQRSRLVRSWTHLERQRGGFGFLGGPGESQIELDRRRIDERITRIERELEAVKRTRGLHRAARERVAYPVIALVGYTNAGKSTLFNRLTGAAVGARDQLFATLDPTMRVLDPAVGPAGDPVRHRRLRRRSADRPGRGLPRHAGGGAHRGSGTARARHGASRERGAAAGRARGAGAAWTWASLGTRGACSSSGTSSTCLPARTAPSCAAPAERQPATVCGSALTGEGIEALLGLLDRSLSAAARVVELELDSADGARLAWLYRHGTVLERRDGDGRTHLRVALPPAEHAPVVRMICAAQRATRRCGKIPPDGR